MPIFRDHKIYELAKVEKTCEGQRTNGMLEECKFHADGEVTFGLAEFELCPSFKEMVYFLPGVVHTRQASLN